MKIEHQGKLYRVDDDHPYAAAILALARSLKHHPVSHTSTPQRNDVKQLWRHLRSSHRRFLRAVSKDSPVTQADLQKKLDLDWKQLRGVHNGLARICDGLGIEKPVRTSGYNAENRTYEMSTDVATTIRKIPRKRKP
jgi:hypothetical protein